VKILVTRNGEEWKYECVERDRASSKHLPDWSLQGRPSIAKMNTSADGFP
jgi:hypothetical protein